MTTLYISGPMTGLPEHNFPAFNHAAHLLRRSGYRVLNPAEKGIVDGWGWEDYLRHDLSEVLVADGIAVLEGASNSRGAWLETTVAFHLGVPIRSVVEWVRL